MSDRDAIFLKALGERISEARKSKGLSQAELANAIGMTQLTVSRVENGRQQTGDDKLKLIADVVGIDYDEMMAGSGRYRSMIKQLAEDMHRLKHEMDELRGKATTATSDLEYLTSLYKTYGSDFFYDLKRAESNAALVAQIRAVVAALVATNLQK